MYLINKEQNRISKIQDTTFSKLGFRERENLQEWIDNNPECLGEELLIIQKEFDGFNDTNERLDLLALDKQGNLVIIENKLDDTGKDVTWQALKYASYCSSLSKNQIRDIYQKYLEKKGKNENAEENLTEFFNNVEYEELQLNQGQTQKIIMVARKFKKEVTSTVLWLMNYKLKIKCLKVTPYKLGEQLLLDIEQIIPIKDAEKYIISIADKNQEDINSQQELKERHIIRREFWNKLLKEINSKCNLFQNVSSSKDSWIAMGSGVSGITFNFVVTHTYARVEIYFNRGIEENNFLFDELYKMKDELENNFGKPLEWERLDGKNTCRIKYELKQVDIFNKDEWDKMIKFMVDGMIEIDKTFREPIRKVANKLKGKN